MEDYEIKGQTTTIRATSRMSIKINETFYTFEYSEERMIPQIDNVDYSLEREKLWEECHSQVDKQCEEIYEIYRKK